MSPCPGLDRVLLANGLQRQGVNFRVGDCLFDALVWLLLVMFWMRTSVQDLRLAGCGALQDAYRRYNEALACPGIDLDDPNAPLEDDMEPPTHARFSWAHGLQGTEIGSGGECWALPTRPFRRPCVML